MLNLWYSNNVTELVSAFNRNAEGERRQASCRLPGPTRIIVPNLNIAAYLKFEVARLTGIAVNLDFVFLEKFLSEFVRADQKGMRVIDREVIESLLLGLFSETDAQAKLPAEITSYLCSGGEDRDAKELRQFQLSANLSHIFNEYGLSRPEMLSQWALGKTTLSTKAVGDVEKWQLKLWNLLFGKQGALDKVSEANGARYVFFKDIADYISFGRLAGSRLHMFGFSYVSRTFNLLLKALSEYADVYVYTLNPCLEFWEDVMTKSELLQVRRRFADRADKLGYEAALGNEDPFHLQVATDNPVLRLWGRPGRENIRILNELTECTFHAPFSDPLEIGERTLLRQLQHDLLFREPEQTAPPVSDDFMNDKSVRILECPEMRREVEIIANEIWALVMEDDMRKVSGDISTRLRFSDIAVVIADSAGFDGYKTHFANVFNEIREIPHNINDISFSGENRTIEAIELLLHLPLSGFSRNDLLKLLTHPAVLVRFPEVSPEDWKTWCSDLSVIHGIDSQDHRETYIKKDLFNWDQGLRRLVLGAFLSGERSGEKGIFRAGDDMEYIPEDLAQSSLPTAATLVLLVRSLIADVRFMRGTKLKFSEWADLLLKFVKSYIGPDSSESGMVLSRCLAGIASLRLMDLEGREYSYRIVYELVTSALSGIRGSRGQYLANGVTISSFIPMRPIPFKVVFIAGMGERSFPARETRNSLDLKMARRVMGDVSSRERDQYNFLETLMSTSERLYLSYVCRDGQTGERLEPSSVIKELLFVLEKNYLGPENTGGIIISHPLRRYDQAYFPELFGGTQPSGRLHNFSLEALREAQTAALRNDLASYLKKNGYSPDIEGFAERPGTVLSDKVAGQLCAQTVRRVPECAIEEPIKVSFHAVRKFLQCPLQGWASYQLGLREDETEDPLKITDEPFAMARMDRLLLLRRVFVESLKNGPAGLDTSIHEIYRQNISYAELKGITPTGIFLEGESVRLLSTLDAWRRNLLRLGLAAEDLALKVLRFGPAKEDAAADEFRAPITLSVKLGNTKARTELGGKTESLGGGLQRSFTFVDKDKIAAEDFLRGFLDYVFLSMSGLVKDKYAVTVISRNLTVEKESSRTIIFDVLDNKRCLSYAAALLEALLNKTHTYLFPIEAYVKYSFTKRKEKDVSLGLIIAQMRDNTRSSYSSLYGPVPHPELFKPPDEEEARGIGEERLGPFIEAIVAQWGGA